MGIFADARWRVQRLLPVVARRRSRRRQVIVTQLPVVARRRQTIVTQLPVVVGVVVSCCCCVGGLLLRTGLSLWTMPLQKNSVSQKD